MARMLKKRKSTENRNEDLDTIKELLEIRGTAMFEIKEEQRGYHGEVITLKEK